MRALNGQAMSYDVEGAGVPPLFIYYVTTDRHIWGYQRKSFANCILTIAVNIMGHGNSAGIYEGLSLEDAVGQVRELLTYIKVGPAFVIRVSMGATIALKFTMSAASFIRGLILVSPWNHDASMHTEGLVECLFRLAGAREMTKHADFFIRYVLPPTFIERYPVEFHCLHTLTTGQDAKAVAYSWAASLPFDLTETLRDICVPSLMISDFNDSLTPPYLARAIAEELAEVEFEVWEGTGHFPFFEDPARFNWRLEVFIRRCLTPPLARKIS